MDCRTKQILIWGSSIVGALALILFILLLASGIITGRLTYIVDGEVYTEQSGASVKKYTLPDDPEKEGYVFGGWFSDEKLEEPFELNKIGFLGIYYGNRKVYADFKVHVHVFETRVTTQATCSTTGIKIQICKDPKCNLVKSTETVAVKQHTVSNGELVAYEKPDGTLRFSFEGKCNACRADLYVRNVTADVTSKEVTKVSCQADGEIRYTYKAYGNTYTYTQKISKSEHILNERPISDYYTYDGFVAYGTKNVYVSENVTGTPKCETTFAGKFICEDCEKYIEVTVKQPHNDNVTVKTAPTCTDYGVEARHCIVDGCSNSDREVDISPLGHVEFWYLSKGTAKDAFILNCECSREGCDFVIYESETADNQFITSATLATSTCGENGRVLHTYNDDDLDISIVDLLDRLPHTLNGVKVNSLKYADGSFKFGIDGLLPFAGKTAPKCGEKSDQYYYICEECEQVVPSTVDRRHSYTCTVVKAPKCDADGVLKYTCSDCSHTYQEVIPMLEHIAVFIDGKRKVVYQTNDDGIIYAFQDGIALPEDYVPVNNDVVKGLYMCESCKGFIETDVFVRLER